jgi:hypothetical protein
LISAVPSRFAVPKVLECVLQMQLSNDELSQAEAVLKGCFTQLVYSIRKTHETKADLKVSGLTGPALEEYFIERGNENGLKCFRDSEGTVKFSKYCKLGFASEMSHADLAFVVGESEVPVMFVEEKSTSDSPLESFGQALAESSNGLIAQLQCGMEPKDCIVLIICTNGHLFQFGFGALLNPCFVRGGVVSCVLDASSVDGRREVARWLAIYKRHCQTQVEKMRNLRLISMELEWALDRSIYYTKHCDSIVLHFDRDNPSSWLRFVSIFNVLWSCEELRQHVVFPLGFETDKKGRLIGVLFEKLDSSWKLGIPANDCRAQYCVEVRRLLRLVHSVKLVHMDFLPCNIAWKVGDNGKVEIKLLDFDTACDSGVDIPGVLLFHRNHDTTDCIWDKDERRAVEEFDAWYCYLLERVPAEHCVTQSIHDPDTRKLLDSFRSWLRGESATLRAEFGKWLEEFKRK